MPFGYLGTLVFIELTYPLA